MSAGPRSLQGSGILRRAAPHSLAAPPAAPSNFDNFVNGKKLALVEFYAPWFVPPARSPGAAG